MRPPAPPPHPTTNGTMSPVCYHWWLGGEAGWEDGFTSVNLGMRRGGPGLDPGADGPIRTFMPPPATSKRERIMDDEPVAVASVIAPDILEIRIGRGADD